MAFLHTAAPALPHCQGREKEEEEEEARRCGIRNGTSKEMGSWIPNEVEARHTCTCARSCGGPSDTQCVLTARAHGSKGTVEDASATVK